jgi:formylglycine-generating enzyme required for sulfatase activity
MKNEKIRKVKWFIVFLYTALLLLAVTRWMSELLKIFSPSISSAVQGMLAAATILISPILFFLQFFPKRNDHIQSEPKKQDAVPAPVSIRQLEQFYNDNLLKECERYDLGDLDEERMEDNTGLRLSDVYVDQEVTVFDPRQETDRSEQKNMTERKATPLFQALEKYADSHCILSGIVGSGKSSFVNFLTADIIRSFANKQSSALPGNFACRTVVRIRLREIGAAIDATSDADGLLLRHIRKQIRRYIISGCKGTNGVCAVSDQNIEQYCDELVTELQKNGVLLLDGLDEITLAEDKRQTVQRAIRSFIDHLQENSSCRLILTSRPPGLTGAGGGRYQPPGFVRLELQSMSLEQAAAFIERWYEKKAQADKRISAADPTNSKRSAHLIMQIRERPSLEELTETPMLLTLMLLVDSGNYRLPESRAELYDRAVKLLLQRWHLNLKTDSKSLEPETRAVMEAMADDSGFTDSLREALSHAALESYQNAEDTGADKNESITFSQTVIIGSIGIFLDSLKRSSEKKIPSTIDSTSVRNFLENRSNILIGAGEGNDRLQFVHKSFHEFLAAEFYGFDDDSRTAVNTLLEDSKKRDWWREVLLFWMNARTMPELDNSIRPLFLEPIKEMDEQGLNDHAAAVLLCSEAAVEKNLRRYADVDRNEKLNRLFTAAQKKLLRLMGNTRVALPHRAEAGRLLGELGDPRPGVTVYEDDKGRPDIDWVEIPSANGFMMGTDDEDAYDDEKPAHPVDVDGFSISRYPITNAQYRCFIKAGGYERQQYWRTDAAKHWWAGGVADEKMIETVSEKYRKVYQQWLLEDIERRAPRFWHERKWNNPNHPVVGVSWFESLAFCCWLAEVAGESVRLPSEEEWEYAARGVKGLQYSWGDEFAESLGNTKKTGLERTSAVGIFPPGKAVGPQAEEFGLSDMTGNVWEWTANRWGKDSGTPQFTYADWRKQGRKEREDRNVNEFRVIRGGSWNGNLDYARCSFRSWDYPGGRYDGLGFRVVFSLADF